MTMRSRGTGHVAGKRNAEEGRTVRADGHKTDPTIARFWRDAAKQWKAMAAQLELLEQEPVYRIIRSRKE